MPMERFTQVFSALPDPRADNTAHDLTEILFIALLATLCGAQTCCDIALFAKTKESLLRRVLVLAHGVPSHDTFSRVFRLPDPHGIGQCFGGGQQRSGGRLGAYRTADVEGLRGHRRCAALPSCDGAGDCR